MFFLHSIWQQIVAVHASQSCTTNMPVTNLKMSVLFLKVYIHILGFTVRDHADAYFFFTNGKIQILVWSNLSYYRCFRILCILGKLPVIRSNEILLCHFAWQTGIYSAEVQTDVKLFILLLHSDCVGFKKTRNAEVKLFWMSHWIDISHNFVNI